MCGGGIVEDVVLYLESHTHGLAEAAHRGDLVARGPDGQRSGRGADAQQAGGFLIYNVEVGLTGHRAVLGTFVLQDLALAQCGHRAADMGHQIELPAL